MNSPHISFPENWRRCNFHVKNYKIDFDPKEMEKSPIMTKWNEAHARTLFNYFNFMATESALWLWFPVYIGTQTIIKL